VLSQWLVAQREGSEGLQLTGVVEVIEEDQLNEY